MEGNNDILVDEIFMNKKENILGTTLYHYKDAYTVRGILSSFTPSVYAYKEEQTPYVFFPMKDNGNVGHCYIKCYTDKKEEVRQWMTQLLQEVLPESVEPEITTFLDDIIEQQAMATKFKNITLFFSIVSLIITLLGVYSAITLDTERRQKEVAIRKRPDTGLLAGLYEFPNVEGHLKQKEVIEYAKSLGLTPVRVKKLPDAKHIFSHVEWQMKGYEVIVDELERELDQKLSLIHI